VTNFDHVTGLCSRGDLEAVLASQLAGLTTEATRAKKGLAIVICDIVGLKHVNDSAGFREGDAVLAAAAGQLKNVASDADMLARLGGDEFVAVYAGEAADQRAAAAFERLRSAGHSAGAAVFPAPQLRIAWGSARPGETSGDLINRLYAQLRAS